MEEARIWCRVCVYVAFIAAAVVATDAITARRNVSTFCPGPIRYYEDMGCTPVFRTEQARCPSRYNCDHLKERSRTKCYINGHEYKINQVLNREDANICEDITICFRGSSNDEIAAFHWINIENKCPKVPISDEKRCYLRKSPLTCCGDKQEICLENPNDRPFCIRDDGYKFLDGEAFYLKEKPGLTCICQPGYEGKNVPPFCIKSNHTTDRYSHPAFRHIDYFGKKCAPLLHQHNTEFNRKNYYDMRCHDPYAYESVVPREYSLKSDENQDEKNVCLYGSLTMRLGDGIMKRQHISACKAECICEVPPVPTCEPYTSLDRNCDTIRQFFEQP